MIGKSAGLRIIITICEASFPSSFAGLVPRLILRFILADLFRDIKKPELTETWVLTHDYIYLLLGSDLRLLTDDSDGDSSYYCGACTAGLLDIYIYITSTVLLYGSVQLNTNMERLQI